MTDDSQTNDQTTTTTDTTTPASPLSDAAVTTPRDDMQVGDTPAAPPVVTDGTSEPPAPVEIAPEPPTPVPPLSTEDRLAAVEADLAFLREIFGWPTKDDIE